MRVSYTLFLNLFIFLLFTVSVKGQSYYAIDFVENKGQWEGSFNYRSESGNGALFIEKNGYTILQHHADDFKKLAEFFHGNHAQEANGQPSRHFNTPKEKIRSHALKVKFLGARSNPDIIPESPRDGIDNYFLGNDPTKWKSNVKTFSIIRVKNMYAGVDVKYYSEGGRLKYDLLVSPGADLNGIRVRYDGAVSMKIKNGELVVTTSVGEVKDLKPYAYQVINGLKKEVPCSYVLKGNEVTFKLSDYDPKALLIIDPTLIFSTYTGSRSGNWGYTATPGVDGSLYAGGIVFNGGGYPVTAGAFQSSFQGAGVLGVDISITRFSPNGTQRIYSTFLGGNQDEFPHSMFADPAGNLVILGRTTSSNFPVRNTLGTLGQTDIIVAKLNAAGTNLIGSIKIGGSGDDGANVDASGTPTCSSILYNYGDNARSEIVLDEANNVYVAASSQSTNFPLQNAVQTKLNGKQDAVLLKLDPNVSTVLFSTYYGGKEDDAGFVLAIDPITNDIFMAGATASNDLPNTNNAFGGSIDGYVAQFSNNGLVHRRTRYFGTAEVDIIFGIQIDDKGFPYIMGISLGNWPVINATYSNPGSKQFISKLQQNLTGFVYSTVYGSANSLPNISPVAFLVDRCENVYISGWGGKLNPCSSNGCFDLKTAGTISMPITSDAIKSTTDGRDFYFFVMEKDATRQLYGSYFGQTGGETDHVDGGTSRFDKRGAIYMAICANCMGNNACPSSPITQAMPVTPGVVSPRNQALTTGSGGECNLAAVKVLFDYQGVIASVQSSIDGNWTDSIGCVPLKVDFTDTIGNATRYEWLFGDGTPVLNTTDPAASHTFTTPGIYRVRLIAIDDNKCIPRDTAYKLIRVRADKVLLNFSNDKLPPCESLRIRFNNLSIAPVGAPFKDTSFIWDFGDNSPLVKAGTSSVNHTYRAPGTYTVKLILNDTSYCNYPDTLVQTVRIAPNVTARFTTPVSGCAPYTAIFTNTSIAGETYQWDFGDGTSFIGATPPNKQYSTPGNYTVRLIAIDPNTCNVRDTARIVISVYPNPRARFNYTPITAQENVPTTFTNLSTGAIAYKWFFGDGDSSTVKDPVHQYNKTGTFQTCLIAFNEYGCTDTTCATVDAIVVKGMDVPNAFSPNGDGVNDRVYVRGFGIEKMNFRIYNRQGLLMFQSTSPSVGWDGKYKGMLQPMDVYAYVVDVEFTDGTSAQKKGDITLLR